GAIAALVNGDAFRNSWKSDGLLWIEAVSLREVQQIDEAITDREILTGLGNQVHKGIALAPIRNVADAAGDDDLHVRSRLLHFLERVQLTVDAVLGLLS